MRMSFVLNYLKSFGECNDVSIFSKENKNYSVLFFSECDVTTTTKLISSLEINQ